MSIYLEIVKGVQLNDLRTSLSLYILCKYSIFIFLVCCVCMALYESYIFVTSHILV